MSKKKRRPVISRKKLKEKRLATYPQPIYAVGDLVQVNDGVMDANWDALPIGGWVGKITKIQREETGPKYEVVWTGETLDQAHPIFGQLASFEGLKPNEYTGLEESDLHLFPGGPVTLVAPTDVSMYAERPLDPDDRADRLRMIFDTKPLEWFPTLGDDEDDKNENDRLIRRYYDYLSERLAFPFEAAYVSRNSGRSVNHRFTVEKLIAPDVVKAANWNGPEGLYCSGVEPDGKLVETPLQKIVFGDIPQKQLLDDYRSWIGDFGFGWPLDEDDD